MPGRIVLHRQDDTPLARLFQGERSRRTSQDVRLFSGCVGLHRAAPVPGAAAAKGRRRTEAELFLPGRAACSDSGRERRAFPEILTARGCHSVRMASVSGEPSRGGVRAVGQRASAWLRPLGRFPQCPGDPQTSAFWAVAEERPIFRPHRLQSTEPFTANKKWQQTRK